MPIGTDQKRRKKWEAVRGAALFAAIRIAAVILLLGCASLAPELGWLQGIAGGLALILVIPIPLMGITIRQRFREIEGGELDAAAKY